MLVLSPTLTFFPLILTPCRFSTVELMMGSWKNSIINCVSMWNHEQKRTRPKMQHWAHWPCSHQPTAAQHHGQHRHNLQRKKMNRFNARVIGMLATQHNHGREFAWRALFRSHTRTKMLCNSPCGQTRRSITFKALASMLFTRNTYFPSVPLYRTSSAIWGQFT